MVRIASLTVLLVSTLTASTFAQNSRVEINPFFGYTFSEGVNIDPLLIEGEVVTQVNPTSGLSYGLAIGVFVTENTEIGFQWSQQDSTLEGKGATRRDFADMKVNNYHAIFTYNWGDGDASTRPFLFGGIGATNYSPSDAMGNAVDSETKFSTTWGGGVKVYPSPRVGFSFTARWTPTYIKSDPAGVWCSPYWPGGCFLLSEANYSNQLELSGGVSLRF